MLKSFKIKNFKGFKEELVFDFSNPKKYSFNENCIKDNLVNKGIIYGYNSSGKSNLGLAIFDIISTLTDFNSNSALYLNYINAETENELAEFTYEFKIQDTIVKYFYKKKSQDEIVYEELFFNEKLILKFDKAKDKNIMLNLEGTENFDTEFSIDNMSALRYVKSNAKHKEDSIILKLFDFIYGMLFFKSVEKNQYIGFQKGSSSLSKIVLEKGKLSDFQNFLENNGLKYKLCEMESDGEGVIGVDFGFKKVKLDSVASTGTKSLWLFYRWLMELEKVSFLFIDEFDSFYHSVLSEEIVKKLLARNSVQVILTTHNSSLLSNDLLRPDCYFILKDSKIKPICDLTDKEIREAHNLEKMFRSGVFGVSHG